MYGTVENLHIELNGKAAKTTKVAVAALRRTIVASFQKQHAQYSSVLLSPTLFTRRIKVYHCRFSNEVTVEAMCLTKLDPALEHVLQSLYDDVKSSTIKIETASVVCRVGGIRVEPYTVIRGKGYTAYSMSNTLLRMARIF